MISDRLTPSKGNYESVPELTFICSRSIAALITLFLIFLDRQIGAETLRSTYLRSLYSYMGTTYVWGGENQLGIDCSGLVRDCLRTKHIRSNKFNSVTRSIFKCSISTIAIESIGY
jgi:NlpC/P60 family